MTQKKYSSSLSRQLSKTKPNTKLVLVIWEQLLYLEFNKPNKQNVYEINLYKKNSTFLSLKIIVDTLIDVRNETSKPILKIS